jgi:transportin-1
MLISASTSPNYVNYLTYIFTSAQLPELGLSSGTLFSVRYSAAINLKNYIKLGYKSIPRDSLDCIKNSVLSTLQDTNPQLRSFAGTVITEIVQQGGLLQWPEILQDLMGFVSNPAGDVTAEAQEGAMSALAKVCEDNRKLLDKDYHGQRPMTVIVPKLLQYTGNSNSKIRVFALKTLKSFIPQKSQVLFSQLDTYLSTIFNLTADPNIDVKRIICQSLVQLVETRPDMLAPHIDGLVNYILSQQQQFDLPELALDAAEFWLSVGEQDELRDLMGPYLPKVIPVLLTSMVYGEDDVARLEGDEDDADEEDRPENIKPQFAALKAGRGATTVLANGVNGHSTPQGADTPSNGEDLSEGEVEEDEDDDYDDDDPESVWSLRKCSAAALDVFAVNYHAPVFDIVLPYLMQNLQNELWPRREAAVLALGAIADGCMSVVAPHLPQLVPFLISLLSDKEPVVRQITCWCLGRYSEWASHLQSPTDTTRFFEPMMQGLLERMLDRNKKVQEAGASGFASLEEKSGQKVIPYTEPILRQFTQCFSAYKDKNMYILYDCVQTLAENVGPEMAKPDRIDLLMPVLIGRWNKVADESRELFPLLGCLGYVAQAYGDKFAEFAPPIFSRCVKVIYQTLQAHMAFVNNQSIDEPDKDFIVTSLDLLSAIIQAIEPAKSARLVAGSDPQFFDLLSFCMEDPTTDVRQSSYALLGDCAITIYPQLEPFLPKLIPLLIRQLDLDIIRDEDSENGFNVLNNVAWSCGEIGSQAGDKMAPYVEPLYQALITIIKMEDVPDSVNENASMTLGRLGLGCADQLASHLPEFAEPFLTSMAKIVASQEKASAFVGFNQVIERNPQAMERALREYFTASVMFPQKGKAAQEYAGVRDSFSRVSQLSRRFVESGLG